MQVIEKTLDLISRRPFPFLYFERGYGDAADVDIRELRVRV